MVNIPAGYFAEIEFEEKLQTNIDTELYLHYSLDKLQNIQKRIIPTSPWEK